MFFFLLAKIFSIFKTSLGISTAKLAELLSTIKTFLFNSKNRNISISSDFSSSLFQYN